jgi:hypothetical protein
MPIKQKNTKTPKYVKFDEFNIDFVVIQPMKQYPNGGKYFPVMYAYSEEDKEKEFLHPLHILGPSNLSHWGMREFEGNGSWTLSIPILEGVPPLFVEIFQQIDQKVKDYAFQYSEQFFGKKYAKEVAEAFFVETLKPVKDKITGAVKKHVLSFKIPYTKGQFKILLCNDKKRPIFPNATTAERLGTDNEDTPDKYLQKNSTIKFVFNIQSIYITNSRYGYSKTFTQGIVSSPEPTMLEACVIDDSDKEDDEEDEEEEDDLGGDVFGIRSDAMDEDEVGEEVVLKQAGGGGGR